MKTKNKGARKYRRASILPLAVVMVVILFIIGMALLELGFGARLNAIIGSGYIAARAAADAGIAQALHVMNSQFSEINPCDPDWSGHTASGDLSDSAYGSAGYNYSIVTLPGGCSNYEIISTGTALTAGTAARATRTIHAAVRVVTKYEYAIIVEDKIELYAGSVVDGYNSADPTDPITYVKIGTNSIREGMIELYPDCYVDGDVLVGFGGDVQTVIKQQPGATTGPQYPLPSPVPMIRNPAPGGLPAGQPIVYDPCGVATIIQSGVYSDVDIPQGHLLRVGDGINQIVDVVLYVQGDLHLHQGAELRVTGTPGVPGTWSKLAIYLDGDLDAGQSNGINNETLKPGQFRLIGTGPDGADWVIRNAGAFFGVFDGPGANIEIKESGDIFGAVIGKSFEQKAKCKIYYDEDLSEPYSGPVGFAVSRWWEE